MARKEIRASVYHEIRFGRMDQQPDGGSRFVRQLSQTVVIRSLYDAAQHLIDHVFTPFEAFEQGELWYCPSIPKTGLLTRRWCTGGTVNTVYIRQAELP